MKIPFSLILLTALFVSAQEKTEVYFDFNKDFPTVDSASDLQQWIKSNPEATVSELRGFCDSIDVNAYNRTLASRRIENVRNTLQEAGVELVEDIVLRPFGEDFAQSADPAKNRRVEIYFKRPDNRSLKGVEKATAEPKREETFEEAPPPSFDRLFEKVRIGDIVRVRDINFYLNSEIVVPESAPRLLELYEYMQKHPKLSIEIHGHICCNPNINDTKLSYRRAKYIFTYLLKKGIPLNRLAYKGFGSSRPIHRIPERTREQMAENRRVEIKIVNI